VDLKADINAANAMNAYLSDALNNNKGSCAGWDTENAADKSPTNPWPQTATTACDTYVQPQSRALDRDRLHMIVSEPTSHCGTSSRALLALMPCKDLFNIGACLGLVAKLQSCSGCALAATLAITVPCLNTLSPLVHCDPIMTTLKICAP
jgi:hypothetical protein